MSRTQYQRRKQKQRSRKTTKSSRKGKSKWKLWQLIWVIGGITLGGLIGINWKILAHMAREDAHAIAAAASASAAAHGPLSIWKSLRKRQTRNDEQQKPSPVTSVVSRTGNSHNIVDFGAIGDNATDNTAVFHRVTELLQLEGGGELIVPANGVFRTGPFNITSSYTTLTVEGTIFFIQDQYAYPAVAPLPSYGRDCDLNGLLRRHPLLWVLHATHVTIRGHGVVDGGGWYWYPFFHNHTAANHVGRPHIMEIYNCTHVEITQVTLRDSPFWTLHPIYCRHVHIHHMTILAPSCRNYGCANTDGIDIDSCQHVLVEDNYISVGDDHVTILAGKLRPRDGIIRSPPTRNITVRNNILKHGMGLSIGSSTAGGIDGVLYQNNVMTQQVRFQMGNGIHLKMRDRFGGYIRNIAYVDNVFYAAGKPGGAIVIQSNYQRNLSWKKCEPDTCTRVENILIQNLTVHVGNPGYLECYEQTPCQNITLQDIHYPNNPDAKIKCQGIGSGVLKGSFTPNNLFDPESCAVLYNNYKPVP